MTAPAPIADLVYTGEEQALVTAGTTENGEMQYSLEKNGTYSTTIPTGTEAGDYIVWYKIVGGENYNDVEPSSVAVTIGKATPAISVGVSSGTLSPGSSVVIGTSAKNPNNEELTDAPGVTCTYQIGDGEVSAFTNGFSIPKGTAVGTVITITASTAEDANYAAATKTITVTVEACNHTGGGTQTCKGYQCANCGEWYGEKGTHVPDMYGKCTIEGCDKQYEAKIGNLGDTDISCFYDELSDAVGQSNPGKHLFVLKDAYLTGDPSEKNITAGHFYTVDLCGHTVTVADGYTLTFLNGNVSGLGMGATTAGSIVGNVADALVIREPNYLLDINIQNNHPEGYALKLVEAGSGDYYDCDSISGTNLVLNGGKADVLLSSVNVGLGMIGYVENEIIRVAYAEGVDPIGVLLWKPYGTCHIQRRDSRKIQEPPERALQHSS